MNRENHAILVSHSLLLSELTSSGAQMNSNLKIQMYLQTSATNQSPPLPLYMQTLTLIDAPSTPVTLHNHMCNVQFNQFCPVKSL